MHGLLKAGDAFGSASALGVSPERMMEAALCRVLTLLGVAKDAIARGDTVAKANALAKAGKLVEFLLGLSGLEPGELSEKLAEVYGFVLSAIALGNLEDSVDRLEAAGAAIEELLRIWRSTLRRLDEAPILR